MCLQYDKIRHHSAPHSVKQIQDLTLEVLPHAQYYPDLAPQRFSSLLGPRKTAWMSLRIIGGGERGGT